MSVESEESKTESKGITVLRDNCVDGGGRGRLRGKRQRRVASEKVSVVCMKARSPEMSPQS